LTCLTISRDLLLIADDAIEYTESDDPFCTEFYVRKYIAICCGA
jgi:hypothetical protein